VDLAGTIVEQLGQPVGEHAACAQLASVQFALVVAAAAPVGGAEPGAVGAQRLTFGAATGKDAVLSAAWAVAAYQQCPVVAGSADGAIGPPSGDVAEVTASTARALLPASELLTAVRPAAGHGSPPVVPEIIPV
jgi:hypothetical protein